MNINNSLTNLGLTQNEIDIYSYILNNKAVSGKEVYKDISMDKSSFYRALKSLENRNLIYSSGETRNQMFKASPFSNIQKYIKIRKQELNKASKEINNFIQNIEKYTKEKYKDKNIKIFEGEDAYYSFMNEILKEKNIIFRDLSAGCKNTFKFAKSKINYYKFMNYFIKERLKRNIKIRILLDSTNKNIDKYDQSCRETLKEARIYKGIFNLNCFLNTFGDKSGFFTEKSNKFWAVIIKDEFITELLNSLFDIIWADSRKI